MKRNAFTLIELLVTILIIAIVSGIGFVFVKNYLRFGEKSYYNSLESNILVAGNDYYLDHREKLPFTTDNPGEISLGDLVESNYLEPVKDSEGNTFNNGTVYAYRENGKYVYEVCLMCDNYQSDGKYCQKYTFPK